MYNKDSLQYHGIENIEFRNLCVKNKGFTFGYPLGVPAKITAGCWGLPPVHGLQGSVNLWIPYDRLC
jgi:hypothetical protein